MKNQLSRMAETKLATNNRSSEKSPECRKNCRYIGKISVLEQKIKEKLGVGATRSWLSAV